MLTSIYSDEIEEWNNAQIESGNQTDNTDSNENSVNYHMPDLYSDIFREGNQDPEYSECF